MKTAIKIGLILLVLVAFTGCDAVLEGFYPGFAPKEEAWLEIQLVIDFDNLDSPKYFGTNETYRLTVGAKSFDVNDSGIIDLGEGKEAYFYYYPSYTGVYEIYFSGPVLVGSSENISLNIYDTLSKTITTPNVWTKSSVAFTAGETTFIEDFVVEP